MDFSEEELKAIMDQNRKELNQRLPNYSRIAEIQLQKEEFAKTPKKSIKRYLYQ
jgi:long-chain acyl-CoA synthetase